MKQSTSHACCQFHRKSAFTLIELSIVLVIIGLIVGGVLVGRDLIRAAEVRAQVAQVEKLQTAVHTFREKYGSLPGDMAGAAQFGFTQAQGGADGWAPTSTPGDGLIMSCHNDSETTGTHPPYGFVAFGCENAMFWNHLSQTRLIEGSFTQTGTAANFINILANTQLYTQAATMTGNYIIVNAWNGVNYIYISGVGQSLSNTAGSIQALNKLTPAQSYAIDAKTDDGLPITGRIRAIDYVDGTTGGNLRINLNAASGTVCRSATNAYNMGSTTANTPLCQLQIAGGY